jgi:23S rRNA (adenine2503-C2)-methyltransferase
LAIQTLIAAVAGRALRVAWLGWSRQDANAMNTRGVTLESAGVSFFNERWSVLLADGARVECVAYRGDTLCVSSQVGCAVRCPFCASGAAGLARGLTLDELVGQVECVQALGRDLRRVTLSGVGEPLHNHAHALGFLEWCRSRRLQLSVTTSGGPLPRLAEWLHAPHNGLTVSVHAGTEAMRARMVPHGPRLDALFEQLECELPRMTQRRRKKTALAYLLCDGVNDTAEEVAAFAERALPLGLHVHLYAYNEVPTSEYRQASRARYEQVSQQLRAAGLRVRMSSQARVEANGGCGSLVALRPHSRSNDGAHALGTGHERR